MYIQAMRQPKFSGVHSLSTGWKDDRRKILFFVWELPDGAYAVQELGLRAAASGGSRAHQHPSLSAKILPGTRSVGHAYGQS